MRKQLFLSLAFLCFFGLTTQLAHAQSYEKGTKVLNLGLGIGGWYDYYGFGAPGLSASLEVGIWPTGDFGVIGLGGYSGVRFSSDKLIGGYDVNYFTLALAPRGTYHFTIIPVENLDVYAAAQLVFAFANINYGDGYFSDDVNDLDLNLGLVAGARYYFNEKFGVFGELGYNLNYLTAGISLKF